MESLEEETDSWVEASRPDSSSKFDELAPILLVVVACRVWDDSEKGGISKIKFRFLNWPTGNI